MKKKVAVDNITNTKEAFFYTTLAGTKEDDLIEAAFKRGLATHHSLKEGDKLSLEADYNFDIHNFEDIKVIINKEENTSFYI